MAKVWSLSKPSHKALGPGWPSLLRPKNPPKLATTRTMTPRGGGASGGAVRCTTIQAACHSSGAKTTSQGKLGHSRPQVTRCRMRQAMDQVDHQSAFEPLQRAQLQSFDLTPRFQDAEKDFDQPAAAIPVDEFDHGFQGFGTAVGQQTPCDGLFTGRWLFLAGQNCRDGDSGCACVCGQSDSIAIQRLAHRAGGPIRRCR